ncbi:hypothetical protein [Neisseria sicca]|nr:hypothetical protein [Neisseria sicca]
MHPFRNNDGKRRSSETDKKPDCPIRLRAITPLSDDRALFP